jgi:hypothetical protein
MTTILKDCKMNSSLRFKEKIESKVRILKTKDRNEYLAKRDYFSKEGLKCDICFIPLPEFGNKEIIVDHCHRTGNIRGILCSRCNRMLGFADDNPEILLSSASYLDKTRQ